MPHVLVSALCLSSPPGTRHARGRGPDAGVLRPAVGPSFLANVDRRKGKFRAFLLAALKHFLANEWDRRLGTETRRRTRRHPAGRARCRKPLRLGANRPLTPERLFERQWAIRVLDNVLARLEAELAAEGKQRLFDGLKPFLTADRQSAPYAEVAAELGMTEGALKVAVHRLRRRYRELLRDEIAQTVASPEEIDEEIRYLLSCL